MKVAAYLLFNVYKVQNSILYTSFCIRKGGYKNFYVYFFVFAKTNNRWRNNE